MNVEQIGPYRLEAELGRGGMATVYRAFHIPLRRYVALKVLNTLLSQNTEFQERFDQEARVAAQLEHPNIISIYDLGIADGLQYIAMRLIEGPTLEEVIRDGGPMPAQRVLAIVAETADALAYAHQQGVFHRDVKPSNIMLRQNDRPILADFGIARAVEGLRLTMSQSVLGTPRYMSPEQARAQPVDQRSDIYSLGVVMYEMLGGQPPFTASNTPSLLYMHVHEPPPPLSAVRPDLSPGVRELVNRCLAKPPDERFQNAAQVVSTCRALLTLPDLDASSTMVLPPWAPTSQTQQPSIPPGSRSNWGVAPVAGTGRPAPAPRERPADLPPAAQTPQTSWPPEPVEQPQPRTPTPPAAAPPDRPEIAEKRSTLPMPLIGGVAAALVVIVGMFLLLGDRLPGRGTASSPTPTAVAKAAAAATTAPAAKPAEAGAAGQPATAPSPASGPAPATAPSPAAASASPAPAAAGAAGGADASRRLGDAMTALGRRDYAAALEQANAGLQAAPTDPGLAKAAVQARLGLAEQLWAQGSPDQALPHFLAVREQPLRSAASSSELREAELAGPFLWADLTVGVDRTVALSEYEKVFRRDPNYRDVREKVYTNNVALATQLISQGDRQGAVRYVNAARAIDPNRADANNLIPSLTPTATPSQ